MNVQSATSTEETAISGRTDAQEHEGMRPTLVNKDVITHYARKETLSSKHNEGAPPTVTKADMLHHVIHVM